MSSKAVVIKKKSEPKPKSGEMFTPEQVEIIKRQICRGASDDELKVFLYNCARTKLDPFARQIYAVRRKSRGGPEVMTIQTSIDGFRLVADRSRAYAGSDDAIYTGQGQFPETAKVTVYKIVKGQRCPYSATARWKEYYPGDGDMGFMWRKMPYHMLAKVAEALALRKAFPSDLANVYTDDEMDQDHESRPVVGNNFIRPEQPGIEDGTRHVEEFKFRKGSFAQRTLENAEEVFGLEKMRDFVERNEALIANGRKNGKTLQDPETWKEDLKACADYIARRETELSRSAQSDDVTFDEYVGEGIR